MNPNCDNLYLLNRIDHDMHKSLQDLTAHVDLAARHLVSAYQADQLYAFRVNSRRIRSILKHMDSHRSRGYRKTWGGFAAMTNEARDWDVFLITVDKLMTAEECAGFREINGVQIQHSHDIVVDMLKSMHWRRHLEEWVHFLDRVEEEPIAENQVVALDQALAGAQSALLLALSSDDDHTWHRFRIAVKEVRYVADASSDKTEQELASLVNSCKQLQTLLGDWHDTVVQLNMLEELVSDPIHDRLRDIVAGRKQTFLAETRELLAGHPVFSL
jgi:CHAD domain-containing protein